MKALIISFALFVSLASPITTVNPESISIKTVSKDYSSCVVLLDDGSLHNWEVYEAYDNIIVLEINRELHEFSYVNE